MNIFIPSHLKKIPIIKQLYELVVTYSSARDKEGKLAYYEDYSDSFDDYDYFMKSDPVKNFIILDLNLKGRNAIEESGQNFDIVVGYLTNLFYSVKGTCKVIEYMIKYLNITECTYNTSICSPVTDSTISKPDPEAYIESLKDFCNALLYFKNFKVSSKPEDFLIELENNGNIQTIKSGDLYTSSYKLFEMDAEEDNK